MSDEARGAELKEDGRPGLRCLSSCKRRLVPPSYAHLSYREAESVHVLSVEMQSMGGGGGKTEGVKAVCSCVPEAEAEEEEGDGDDDEEDKAVGDVMVWEHAISPLFDWSPAWRGRTVSWRANWYLH